MFGKLCKTHPLILINFLLAVNNGFSQDYSIKLGFGYTNNNFKGDRVFLNDTVAVNTTKNTAGQVPFHIGFQYYPHDKITLGTEFLIYPGVKSYKLEKLDRTFGEVTKASIIGTTSYQVPLYFNINLNKFIYVRAGTGMVFNKLTKPSFYNYNDTPALNEAANNLQNTYKKNYFFYEYGLGARVWNLQLDIQYKKSYSTVTKPFEYNEELHNANFTWSGLFINLSYLLDNNAWPFKKNVPDD